MNGGRAGGKDLGSPSRSGIESSLSFGEGIGSDCLLDTDEREKIRVRLFAVTGLEGTDTSVVNS